MPRQRKCPVLRRCGWCAYKFTVRHVYPQQGTCSRPCAAQRRYHEGRSGITPGSSSRAVPVVEVERTAPPAPSKVDLMWPAVQSWLDEGLTYASIGRRCGVTGKTVRDWAAERGALRPLTPRKGQLAEDARVMARKLHERGVPVAEIAWRVGRSRQTIYRWTEAPAAAASTEAA